MNMTQLELFPTMSDNTTQKKPRFTLKAKKEAKAALLAQIQQGWDPPDAIWRLIDSLNFDILKAEAKKS
jgi:hypothetical protein